MRSFTLWLFSTGLILAVHSAMAQSAPPPAEMSSVEAPALLTAPANPIKVPGVVDGIKVDGPAPAYDGPPVVSADDQASAADRDAATKVAAAIAAKDFAAAWRAVGKIRALPLRMGRASDIIAAVIAAEGPAKAADIALKQEAPVRSTLVARVVAAMIKDGDFEGAKALAARLPAAEQPPVITELAEHLLKSGKSGDAAQMAQSIQDAAARDALVLYLATLAESGDKNEYAAYVAALTPELAEKVAFDRLVRLARTDPTTAFAEAAKIADPAKRLELTNQVARSALAAGIAFPESAAEQVGSQFRVPVLVNLLTHGSAEDVANRVIAQDTDTLSRDTLRANLAISLAAIKPELAKKFFAQIEYEHLREWVQESMEAASRGEKIEKMPTRKKPRSAEEARRLRKEPADDPGLMMQPPTGPQVTPAPDPAPTP